VSIRCSSTLISIRRLPSRSLGQTAGNTTNLPLEDILNGQAFVAFEYDGSPLAPEHGGPAPRRTRTLLLEEREMGARLRTAYSCSKRGGDRVVERLLAFGSEVREVGDEPYERDLIEVFHRPENRVLHDRISERALARLSPAMAAIIADGIELGQFRRQDPRRAAAYVMACFGSLHEVVSDPDDVTSAVDELSRFVPSALGYDGEVPA
jgi:hypothetical protein